MDTRVPGDAFSRLDESDDSEFYARDRFVSHLDAKALDTVERVIGGLLPAEGAIVLDLMASWDSHIPNTTMPAKVVGLGLNQNELRENLSLFEYVIHDLNKDPHLPFAPDSFDAVLCTVSVDYMTQPVEVFREVGRVLRPGGEYIVIFSNRMFAPKAVKIWRESSEEARVGLVEDYFRLSDAFERTRFFVSRGKPRPKDDKYAHLGIPSDPVYAVHARKPGGEKREMKVTMAQESGADSDRVEVERRKVAVRETLCCPHCGDTLRKWEVPQNIFTQWPNEYMYVCFNDECPYYVKGWDASAAQGNPGSYRLMYDPLTDCCQPVPVFNSRMLKEGIID